MGFLETPQDYLDAGVEPPEVTPHAGSQEVPFDHHIHRWTAAGGLIECDGGQHPHGQGYDHLNKVLVGTSAEGLPIFKDVVLANQSELDNKALLDKDNNKVSPDQPNEG